MALRKVLGWLFPLCACVVALSVAWKVWAGIPIWTIEWFAESGKPMLSAPQVQFPTKEDCREFGDDRVAMAEVVAGLHITFKCKPLPFIEAIR